MSIDQFEQAVRVELAAFVERVKSDHPGQEHDEEDWWDAFHEGHGTD